MGKVGYYGDLKPDEMKVKYITAEQTDLITILVDDYLVIHRVARSLEGSFFNNNKWTLCGAIDRVTDYTKGMRALPPIPIELWARGTEAEQEACWISHRKYYGRQE